MASTTLSVILIGPAEGRRRALAEAFRGQQVQVAGELGSYPSFNHLMTLMEAGCDVVVVDLDSDPEVALSLVENIGGRDSLVTVMVYSRKRDSELLVKCMRAGAREFLSEPVSGEVLTEAVVRASARRFELDRQKKSLGKILVFWGAKGGTGVTTLASNFAIALKKESNQEVGLVDLNLHLGDAGVVLGLNPRFSVADALRNPGRLDGDFLATLLATHSSGVSLLAAPDQYNNLPLVQNGNLTKLLELLREQFPYVVVDAGPTLGEGTEVLFGAADMVYLVTHAEVAALRNAQRLIAHLRTIGGEGRHLEVVLNRYDPRHMEIDEGRIEKILETSFKWKVPNDYQSVRQSLDKGIPLALQRTPVTRVLYQMAREACGKPALAARGKWSLF